jgi:copper(I)-binding protein
LEELEVEVLSDNVAAKMQVVPGWMVLLAGERVHLQCGVKHRVRVALILLLDLIFVP